LIKYHIRRKSIQIMLIIVSNAAENIELDVSDVSKCSSIYDLKKVISSKISSKKQIGIDEIHLIRNEPSTSGAGGFKNTDPVHGIEQVILKIIKNRCSVCLRKSAPIVGDCTYCRCAYCLEHRLPETHHCPCLADCQKAHFDKNFKTVMEQKCVASQI